MALYNDSYTKLRRFAQAIQAECVECNGTGIDLGGGPCLYCSAPTPRDLPSDGIDQGMGGGADLE